VTSNSGEGCALFRFTIATRSTDQKVLDPSETCAGIAVIENSIDVVLVKSKNIEHLDTWGSTSSKRFSIEPAGSPGPLLFDKQAQRFLVGDTDGHVYAIPVGGGRAAQLTSGAGWIAELAANSNHILIASGKKILMISLLSKTASNRLFWATKALRFECGLVETRRRSPWPSRSCPKRGADR
jgi:hypothetical protein